jgi:REP element-mobilizing transposase RayT
MSKFRNKYRTHSARLKHWDYSWPGLYFVTVCTANKFCWFGEVVDGKMVDSDFGSIARRQWGESFDIRKELKCHVFALMPNHLHAIVELVIPEKDGERRGDLGADTHGRAYLQQHPQPNKNKDQTNASPGLNGPLQRQKKSISSFIAGYKSAVLTKIDDFIDDHQLPVAKFNRDNPLWQRNYHDHIIRDGKSYHRIRNYIIHNPKNWEDDRQYPKPPGLET